VIRRLIHPFVLSGLLVGAVPAAASAAAASAATIEVHSSFSEVNGTFTADSPVLCDSGTTSDVTRVVGQGATLSIHNLKSFTCADGSGTFTLRIQATVQPCDATDRGAWSVAGGTGDYEQLRGAGTLVGTYVPNNACDAEGIDDLLTGTLVLPA
jgi:hypothetical protein